MMLIAAPWLLVAPMPMVASQPESHSDAKAFSVEAAVDQLVRAYRAGPVSDRVLIRAIGADKKERRAQILLWVDRGTPVEKAPALPTPGPAEPAPKAPSRPPQIRLDLGQLQVHAQGVVVGGVGVNGSLTAVNRFERSTVFTASVRTSGSDLLADVNMNFQPMPFPQLALALGPGGEGGEAPEHAVNVHTISDVMPLAPGLTLDSAETAVEGGRAVVVLKGRHTGGRSGGAVALSVERATGRLRRFTADYDGATGNALARVELVCAPSDQGDAGKWGIATEGRSAVKSPADLAPKRPGLSAGESVKNASLMSEDLAPLSLDTLVPKGSGRAFLVCFRGDGDTPPSESDLRAAVLAASRAVKLAASESPSVPAVVRGVALLGLSEIDPARLSALAARWRTLAADAGLVDTGLLFTASRVLVAEDKGTPADTFVITVQADSTVRAVVIADRKGTSPDGKPVEPAALEGLASDIAGKPK